MYVDGELSENALAAMHEGKLTTKQLADKYNIRQTSIKKFLRPCEWHHVGVNFTPTDFYDEPTQGQIEEIRQYEKESRAKAAKKAKAKIWLHAFGGFYFFSTKEEAEEFADIYVEFEGGGNERFRPVEEIPSSKDMKSHSFNGVVALSEMKRYL